MRRLVGQCLIELTQGDLTLQDVDAIVNAANSALQVGGGVDGAIHSRGGPTIHQETATRYPTGCPTGHAVISSAGELSSKFVIHAVGPVWKGGRTGERDLLQQAIISSLSLAVEHHCQSIAFPAISTGVYAYPIDLAAVDSLEAVVLFLKRTQQPELVRFVLFGSGAYAAFSRVLSELIAEN